MDATGRDVPLSRQLPSLILGGAGLGFVTHPDPASLPASDIIKGAFDYGMCAIDTAPYYDPSETLIGKALAEPKITSQYSRADYILMTKVGRLARSTYDYTAAGVRQSLLRSLERLGTSYLDVVFCHDIEAVTDDDVLEAFGVLLEFVEQKKIRYVGLSSYRIDILARRAVLVREKYGRPVDVIQTWGQLTLLNLRLEEEGLQAFKAAGVSCICNSSPLAIGLLRKGGVPVGKLGDSHPAPPGLRQAVQDLAAYTETQSESLAPLALRYSLWRAHEASEPTLRVCTLTGISTVADLAENVGAAKKLFRGDLASPTLNTAQVEKDRPLFDKAHEILGEWVGWSFTSPPKGWSTKLKRIVADEEGADEH